MAGQLRRNVLAKMWDETQQHFCDGLCANVTSANGSVYTDYTTLFLGLVPEEARAAVWQSVAAHGLERIGAYLLQLINLCFVLPRVLYVCLLCLCLCLCHSLFLSLCSRPTKRLVECRRYGAYLFLNALSRYPGACLSVSLAATRSLAGSLSLSLSLTLR